MDSISVGDKYCLRKMPHYKYQVMHVYSSAVVLMDEHGDQRVVSNVTLDLDYKKDNR